MQTANSLAFNIGSPKRNVRARLDKDPRVASTQMGKARWFTFELSSDADLHDALLDYLGSSV